MEKLKMCTPNLVDENIEKIGALFPNAVTERKNSKGETELAIDFDVLRQELSDVVVEGREERYQFTWPDKRKSMLLANAPISAALRPCREESVDFDNTENLYIEGDNLDVLKLLRETYLNRVKMIYIDPPYNTGNDFVYNDKFSVGSEQFSEISGDYDEQGNRLVKNLDSNGRFHTDWLNMIYPRLRIARDLLTDDGVIFISIDDNEVENLKKMCNEIYGEDCFVDCITWNTRIPKNDNKGIGNIHQYILIYVKNRDLNRQFWMQKEGLNEVFDLLEKLKKQGLSIPEAEVELKKLYNKKGYDRGITLYNSLDENYDPWGKINMSWPNSDTFGPTYDVLHPATNKPTKKPDRGWRWNRETFNNHLDYENVIKRYDGSYICGKIWFAADEDTQPSSVKYLNDVGKMLLRSIISLKSDGGFELEDAFDGKSIFSNPKPTSLLTLLINSLGEKDGIYLDFFSGSATTAHAVMQLNAEDGGNRKFIMVQLPEETDEKSEAAKAGYKNICEIGKERIRRAGQKIVDSYQLSVDSRLIKDSCLFTVGKEEKNGELQRISGLAKINESCSRNLFTSEETAERGDICSVRSDEAGSSVNPIEHSGRTGESFKEGVCTISENCQSLKVGTGNSTTNMCSSEISNGNRGSNSDESSFRNRKNANHSNQQTNQLKTENCPLKTKLDIGFRVLKLDSSNMKDVYYTPEELLSAAEKSRDLSGFADNIKEGRTDEDLLFQVMLDLGIPLSAKITQSENVFTVDNNYLIACFKQVDMELITKIAKRKPYYAVFRDSSFINDSAMVNFEQVFNTYSPTTIRRVL